VTKSDGEVFKARILAADEDGATLDNGQIKYAEVKRAIIEVEFNRKDIREDKER
jgi:hypothetical protein